MTDRTFSGVRAASRRTLAAALFATAGLSLAPGMAEAADDAAAAKASAADAAAVTADDQNRGHDLEGVEATGRKNDLESPKYTSKPVDTPQTITVVTSAVIEAQNLLTLRDILSTVPGITFGAGEGGGGYGDSINLRGYAASSDITVDGVRDSAQYTRSDPFNLEQIEVTNGANGVYSGSGSVGGSINIVSKQPLARDTSTVSLGVGTDNYGRLTIDSNKLIGDGIAVRLNAMVHTNDAPGRDVENFKRWGVAPSIAFGIDTPTRLTLSYFYQNDDNIPQYGIPYYFNAFRNGVVPGSNREAYYGFRNIDTQQIDVNSFTARLDHTFSDRFNVRSLLRYQVVDQFSIASQPQGTFCLASGVNASTNAACSPPDTFIRNVSGTTRDTRNTNLYSQTDFTTEFSTGAIQHNMVAGFSLMSETFHLNNGSVLRNANGTAVAPTFLTTSISNPDSLYTGPLNYIRSGESFGERRNQAIYLFDTAKLTDHFEINGGVRLEHNEGSNRADTYAGAPTAPATTPALGTFTGGQTFTSKDDLVSYRIGLVYKPTAASSFYVAYGNSKTPSQSAVNGACTAATCNVDPEGAENYEIGAKWDALDGRLSLTGSVFRNERTNYKVASNDPQIPDQVLDGQSRVDGVALGAVGRITDKLSVFANYTYLDGKVIRGKSQFCVANPTATGCPLPAADPTGRKLTSTPEHAASLWATYDITPQLQVGYGLTYQGDVILSNTVLNPTGGYFTVDGYTVHRASVTYKINRQAELRLNVNNLTDEYYLTRVRTSATGWATPGDVRNATLTLNYRF